MFTVVDPDPYARVEREFNELAQRFLPRARALVETEDGRVTRVEKVEAPEHAPGLLPRWLAEKGVNLVIAGGMGQRAIGLFKEKGMGVVTGAPAEEPEKLVLLYLDGTLVTGDNVCEH